MARISIDSLIPKVSQLPNFGLAPHKEDLKDNYEARPMHQQTEVARI
jgi:hypothetical protein